MDTGMSQEGRQKVGDALQIFLANMYSLYLKTQNFHWNVSGSEFYSLHILFEKQYEQMAEAIDEVAERVRALGFYVEASFLGFKRNSSLREEDQVLSSKDMLRHLLEGHEELIRQGRALSAVADKERDCATMDLMGRLLNVHEKFAWMLKSQI